MNIPCLSVLEFTLIRNPWEMSSENGLLLCAIHVTMDVTLCCNTASRVTIGFIGRVTNIITDIQMIIQLCNM